MQLTDLGEVSILIEGPETPKWNLLLAHGAGAGMEHGFLAALSKALANLGFRVVRFNFPYKERGKKMPGSPNEAISSLQQMVKYVRERFPGQELVVSGKSYGGRMASHLLVQSGNLGVKGLIYYGFPLHAPGKPSTKRADHLSHVPVPQLFFQGTRDSLADISLIREVTASLEKATLIILDNADHSFKVPKTKGITAEGMSNQLASETANWVGKLK